MNDESKSLAEQTQEYALDKGLDHAWQWFNLHATQRMQAVNFFLVATAFLSTAYVAALRFPAVAIGVSALGILFSFVFYRFEIRIQELVKAGERAMSPAQQKLADLTGIPEFKICETVETAKRPFTKYSIVIRALYGSTGVGFLLALTYAIGRVWEENEPPLPVIAYRTVVVLAAVVALYLGQKLVARDRATLNWFQCVIAIALVSAGIFVLVVSAIRLLR
jgi:hypothetical protein